MSHSADTATLRSEIAALRAELAAVHAEASKRRRQSLLRRKKAAAEPTRSRSDDSNEVVQECPAAPPLVPDSETTEEQDATVEVGAGDGPVDSELRMTGDGAKLRRKRSVKPLRERSANRDKHESRAPRKHLVDHPGRVRERKVAKKVAQAEEKVEAAEREQKKAADGEADEQQGRKAAKAMAAAAKATAAAEWAASEAAAAAERKQRKQSRKQTRKQSRRAALHATAAAARYEHGLLVKAKPDEEAEEPEDVSALIKRTLGVFRARHGLARAGKRSRMSTAGLDYAGAPPVDSGGGTPVALRLEGEALAEGAARLRGVYKLQQRQVNGRPTWRRADGGDQWLAWGGHAWFVQGESSLGGSAGYATLSEECATPDLGRGVWEVPVGGSWQPQPGLRCVRASAAELQPCALRLGSSAGGGGGSEGGPAAEALHLVSGHYGLLSHRLHGRPVWCHSVRTELVLGFADGAWTVCGRQLCGAPLPLLRLNDATVALPELSTEGWLVADAHGGWTDAPTVRASEAHCLPTTADLGGSATLFEDGFAMPGRSARPGRGEGLHDRGTLCLWRWISPVDLKQGSVGNCWLISAIAALAEWPEMVKSLIAQHKLSHTGRFDVTLFHPVQERWVSLAVDDRLPVEDAGDGSIRLTGAEITAEKELWPAILEKAFARLWGSFEALSGNSSALAFKALTGCRGEQLLTFMRKGGGATAPVWRCWSLGKPSSLDGGSRKLVEAAWPDRKPTEERSSSQLAAALAACKKEGALLCAAVDDQGAAGRESVGADGLVSSHAYSVLQVEPNVGHGVGSALLKLRNPWGRQGWTGAWGNGSAEWTQHRAVAKKLRAGAGASTEGCAGTFWISADDFGRRFDAVYVCRFNGEARERQLDKQPPFPPAGLRFELGGSRGGSDAAPPTFFRLMPRMQSHGRPVWRNIEQRRVVAFSGTAWLVQRESSLGKKAGLWAVRDTSFSPDRAVAGAWHVSVGGGKGWAPRADLACVEAEEEELPTPHALWLHGNHDGGEAVARHLGLFKLHQRHVNERPAWRSAARPKEWLAWAGHGWMVQPEDSLGSSGGFLLLSDDVATPDMSTASWNAIAKEGGGWRRQPSLHCDEVSAAELPPSAALCLKDGALEPAAREGAAVCVGLYRLDAAKRSGGRPLWRHVSQPDCLIAYHDGAWLVQSEAALCSRVGWLVREDPHGTMPDAGGGWMASVDGAWVARPLLECVEADAAQLPAPVALRLEGEALAEGAARLRGVYKLQQRQVNGRPTWRRADGGDQWLAWGGHAWFVQGESSLGGSAGYATLSEECATPDLGRGVWEVPVGGSWQSQPGLRCVALIDTLSC